MDLTGWLHVPWAIRIVLDLLSGVVFYVGAAIFTIKVTFWRVARQRRQLAQLDLDEIDRMSGERFEEYLEVLFDRLGYWASTTERHDKGADLILVKDGIRTAVQAKCWRQPVGVEAVRAVVAALPSYRCSRGLVVTNSTFTRTARQAARDNNIELWDRTNLANVLLAVNSPGQPLPIPGVVAWLFNEPRTVLSGPVPVLPNVANLTCATCGKQVTKGVRDYCLDQTARFGGKVYCFEHQRQMGPVRRAGLPDDLPLAKREHPDERMHSAD